MYHIYHKQKPLPVGTTLATDSMSSGSHLCQCHSVPLSHQIQEDLIALLDERDVDDETVTVMNHFQDQIEQEILSLEKQLHTLKKLEETYYEETYYGC
jgi:hypothetical protein